jgi:4-diphosphocytidyl-2-C-methyl-D-erythritol kinase
MIMQSLSLCDTLFMRKTKEPGIQLSARNPEHYPDVTWDEHNLIYKAAKLFMDTYTITDGVQIIIDKQIPSAAGLAGGSSDAAATLKGLNLLFEQNLSTEELQTLGVRLGADVPYCIMRGTALAEGIGEKLTKLPAMPKCHILIAKPPINVSTKFVYENLHANDLKAEDHPPVDTQIEALKEENLEKLVANMGNVLERVTVPEYPVISEIKQLMLENGALGAMMSGSGPTVFGIFTSYTSAKEAYEVIEKSGLSKQIYLTTPYNQREENK